MTGEFFIDVDQRELNKLTDTVNFDFKFGNRTIQSRILTLSSTQGEHAQLVIGDDILMSVFDIDHAGYSTFREANFTSTDVVNVLITYARWLRNERGLVTIASWPFVHAYMPGSHYSILSAEKFENNDSSEHSFYVISEKLRLFKSKNCVKLPDGVDLKVALLRFTSVW